MSNKHNQLMQTGIWILLLALCASFVQRTIGFGFGIFIMTMLPLLMPSFAEATTVSGLLAMLTALVVTIRMWRFINWKRLAILLVAFYVVSSVCVWLLAGFQDSKIETVLGIVLILTSLYFIFLSGRIHIGKSLGWEIGAGSVSGLMGGFFAMQGPPAVLYLISSEPSKEQYMGMISAYLLFGNIGMTIVRAMNGFLTPAVWEASLWGVFGVVIGASLGAWAFSKIPQEKFKYFVYAYIGISGIIILLRSRGIFVLF